MEIFKSIIKIIQRIKRKIVLWKYDNYTYADYLRKQGAQIGTGCYIVPRNFGEPYLLKIGNNVNINFGADLHTHDGGTWIFREEMPGLRVYGPIVIEDNCLIGSYAQVMPNVTIGSNSIVSAGSVVIADVPPNSIVMGVPARRFGAVEKYKEKCIELWKQQKPPSLEIDSIKNYDRSPNQEQILSELKKHLLKVFEDKLK